MANSDEAKVLAAALQTRLGKVFGGQVIVEDLQPLTMGASRDIWSMTARFADGTTRGLILRRDPPTAPRPEQMAREAAALTSAKRTGVPVPEVVDHGDTSAGIGSPYVLMEKLDGETIPRKILRDPEWAGALDGLARSLGQIIARIHQIPRESVPGLHEIDAFDSLEQEYRESGAPSPAFELAWRWLREHRPPQSPPTVVHGDFRHGNLMIDREGVSGVLDWELVHIGDPVEDLGWVCVKAWRFGAAPVVGGFGTREELLDGYAEVSGVRPDLETLQWWEVHGTIRWGVICRRQASRHLSGSEPSLELAMIGRRFSENEHDVLLALGLTKPHEVTDPIEAVEGTPDPTFDDPTANQLLDVLGDYLKGRSGSDVPAYLDRVAGNAVSVIRREVLVGDRLRAEYAARLGALGYDSESAFACAIRDGGVDPGDEQVLDAIRFGVEARMTVDNPRYLSLPG